MNNILYTLAIVSLTTIVACKSETKKDNPAQQLETLKKEKSTLQDKIAKLEEQVGKTDSVKVTKVITTSVTPIMFRNYITVQGKLEADQSVLATSEAPGLLTALYVSNGSFVRKGQVLASLKSDNLIDDDIERGVEELDQQISFAKTLYDKQKRLWEQEIGTEVQLLSAKNNYDALLKKKQSILVGKKRINIARNAYRIVAPISGMVDNLDLKVGQMVSPGMMGIKIVNTGNLKVKANIPENYVSKVSTGDEALIIIPDVKDSILARVNYVSASIDPLSRSFVSELKIPTSSRYKPNMVATVKIIGYKNDRAFVLPAGVVQNTLDGKIVFVEENGIAKLRRVATGESYEGKLEITSGLNLGDNVITTGYEDLNEGDKVEKQIIN